MERIKKLIESLKEKDIDGMLISSRPNIAYLTGFTGDASRLMVSEKGCVFLTDGRYTEQAGNEVHDEIEVFRWIDDNRYGEESYRKFIDEFRITKLGFESDVMTHAVHRKFREGVHVELVSTEGLVESQRMIKDENEVSLLRTACNISDKALELTLPFIKEGVTEKELAARLELNLKMEGADDISFKTIVLAGKRTSLLHGNPGSARLSKGDFVQFDFGALYKGYHADMSRTFVIGKASGEQREFYNVMQSAETTFAGFHTVGTWVRVRVLWD